MTEKLNAEQDDIVRSIPKEDCYICGNPGRQVYSNLNDRLFGSKGTWSLSKCTNPNCELFWLNPLPLEEDIWKAYSNYYTHTDAGSSIIPFLKPLEKGYLNLKYGYYPDSTSIFQKFLGIMMFLFPTEKVEVDFSIMYLHNFPGGKLLDVGCGNGWFLKKMQRLNWDVNGIDFDPAAVDFCKSQGLNVSLGSLHAQNFPDNYFDAVTVNHVIEHVHNPRELLKECYRILKTGGKLILETPNTKSWIHKYIFKNSWFSLDPPRHVFIYNPRNLQHLVNKAGFASIKSTSTTRNESWVFIGSRSIKKTNLFKMGVKKQPKVLHILGRLVQLLSWIINIFNKNSGGEVKLIAKKI